MSGMDQPTSPAGAASRPATATRKRSSSGAGLLSKLPFMRSSGEHRPRSRRNTLESDPAAAASATPSLPVPSFITIPADAPSRHVPAAATAPQPQPNLLQHQVHQALQAAQHKTRRRRGSLRKVALLGRGIQRERREGRPLTIDTTLDVDPHKPTIEIVSGTPISTSGDVASMANLALDSRANRLSSSGLSSSRPITNGYANRSDTASMPDPDATPTASFPLIPTNPTSYPRRFIDTSPTISYSTTDDEDALHMARSVPSSGPIPRTTTPSLSLSSSPAPSLLRPDRASLSSGSESYSGLSSLQRRRSTTQRAKSPLALTSLATSLPQGPDADWDYSETEWWGWIILIVTWTVFVIGMGSCLGVWSWAWDVGTTPYAPPELEDDPTLPIVGYYPALMILTGVMAWVWVVVAWVGMKYFRHAQVSGD
ncbi:hypothetical protein VTJ49DRAFT_4463 [Mycothermus thermophilus]|uniref:Uncharacterized protein n=1 Tax=Humicola insolens TaxID=85995 RepID=A0ABR3VLA3_HUMIN